MSFLLGEKKINKLLIDSAKIDYNNIDNKQGEFKLPDISINEIEIIGLNAIINNYNLNITGSLQALNENNNLLFKNINLNILTNFENIPLMNLNDLHIINKLIILVWSIFITVGIWRSAENYQGRFIWITLTLIILSYRLFILKEIFY